MKFLLVMQYMENYGDKDNPGWKYKGSIEYIVDCPGFQFDHEMSQKKARMVVDDLAAKLEYTNDYTQEYLINWDIVEDSYRTEMEKFQMEMDGEITCPAVRLTYDEVMNVQSI